MNKTTLKTPIILLLVSVLGIVTLVSIAQSQNGDSFDDNRNIARILRLVNSLNREAEKQQAKGFEKRAEMLKNYFQKKTGISNEARLKLNEFAANFQKESESLNAQIKEIRKNQKNKPNDRALPSELAKLRESRNKLFDDSRQSLNGEVAKDDSEKVLKFLQEGVLEKMKNKPRPKKSPKNKEDQNFFEKISFDNSDEISADVYIDGYSWIDYDSESNEVFAESVTSGDCIYDGGDYEYESGCDGASVSATLSDPDGGGTVGNEYTAGNSASVFLFWTPIQSGEYCVDAEHFVEAPDYSSNYMQSSDCTNIELPKIKIFWNDADITDSTQEAVVGQKISLSVAFSGQGTITNPQWTIGGDRVKSYFAFTTLGKVTPLEGLNQQNIIFHWFKGGDDKQVKFTATINGQPYTATCLNFGVHYIMTVRVRG